MVAKQARTSRMQDTVAVHHQQLLEQTIKSRVTEHENPAELALQQTCVNVSKKIKENDSERNLRPRFQF